MGVFKRYKDAQAAQKDAENAMPGAYQSNYTDRINETLDSMGAASNAGYDVGTDSELYRQYRAGAQANARAAAENAAAGAAALSGGYGSSYANSVAQQGYQQAMANVDSGLAGLPSANDSRMKMPATVRTICQEVMAGSFLAIKTVAALAGPARAAMVFAAP